MTEPKRLYLGDVTIHNGEPSGGNPYRASLTGNQRVEAVRAALFCEDISRWTFWYSPTVGGAFRIADPRNQIDWSAMRDEKGQYVYRADGSLRSDPTDV